MKTVELEINGKKIQANEGATILQTAIENKIYIPTLCYGSQVEPSGVCRLCMVEISRKGRKRLVASCVYPVENDLIVQTETPKIRKIRKMIIELLWPAVHDERLLKEYGGDKSRFATGETECSLCGLCVRYCSEVKKTNAAYFQGRGVNRKIAVLPEFAVECLYCGKCFGMCTGGWIVNQGDKALS